MAGWTLLRQADVNGAGLAYALYGHGTPGMAAPFAAWYMARTLYSASFLSMGISQATDYASWASHAGLHSAAAWAGRDSLIYGPALVPEDYKGDAALRAALFPTLSAGGAMSAIIGTPKYLIINKENAWVDISTSMTSGAYYQVQPLGNDVAAILAADSMPTEARLATQIGRGEASETWKFTGQPIWAMTDDAQARLKIIERG